MRPGARIVTKTGRKGEVLHSKVLCDEVSVRFDDGKRATMRRIHLKRDDGQAWFRWRNPFAAAFWGSHG